VTYDHDRMKRQIERARIDGKDDRTLDDAERAQIAQIAQVDDSERPAWQRPIRMLPKLCPCCHCVTRYCICSCCCGKGR
jgi:hypothetical protein